MDDDAQPALTAAERAHLERCVELAEQALAAGDEPFGSVLVGADGSRLAEGRNRVVETGDRTQHPEIELARWAARHLTPEQRAAATVFTSGEHCPMCAAAHGWVGLGRVVYAHSGRQLAQWLAELGAEAAPVRPLGIVEVAPGVQVQGPVTDLATRMRELHRRAQEQRSAGDERTPTGEPVCWLERVCDHCGALADGPPTPVCERCGTARSGSPADDDGR